MDDSLNPHPEPLCGDMVSILPMITTIMKHTAVDSPDSGRGIMENAESAGMLGTRKR